MMRGFCVEAKDSDKFEYLVDAYRWAKDYVIAHGYGTEICWQDQASFDAVTESELMSEAAWVILSCGMRTAVISQRFPMFSTAFLKWHSSSAILRNRRKCRANALRVFGHEKKVDAIFAVIAALNADGLAKIKSRVRCGGCEYLQRFPFLGPATSRHLAKNLGIDVVKPDRHLIRIAAAAGFESPDRFCHGISKAAGDKVSVVDVVLWRFATLHRYYLQLFQMGPLQ
jgi:hypothetical protein